MGYPGRVSAAGALPVAGTIPLRKSKAVGDSFDI
jgi:hypothetical protein